MNPPDIGLNSSNTNNNSTIHPIFDEMPADFTVGDYFTSIGIKPARTPWQDPNRKRSGKPRPPPRRKPTVFWPADKVVQTGEQQADQQQRKRKISTQIVAISPLDTSQIAGTSADAEVFEQGFFLELIKLKCEADICGRQRLLGLWH
jgi:hypothetical protein